MSVRWFLFLALVPHLAAAAPILDNVAKVRALSPEEASRALPVAFEATVIYFDPHSRDLFVQDDTAATYVSSIPPNFPSVALKAGSRVRIKGVTRAGGYYPDVIQERIEILGERPLPQPRRISEEELLLPSLDSQWVEVPAVVTGFESAGLAFTLAVEVHGWNLKLEIPRDEYSVERAASLMQRPVLLKGIAGTVFNTQRQMTGRFFYAPSFDALVPTDAQGASGTPPVRLVSEMLQNTDTARTLVRVAGVVTQSDANGFYLRDDSGSMQVHSLHIPVSGSLVEAEGFAAIAPFRPMLRARSVTVKGMGELPHPKVLDFTNETLSRLQSELVTTSADFLAIREGPTDIMLQCRTGDRFFEAVLPHNGSLPKDLSAGDRVTVTGICELTTTHPTPRSEWVDGFRIVLPASGGITILHHAPWWTLRHVMITLGIMSLVAFGALVWAWMLRLRVKEQTEIIGSQLQRVAVQDERHRIARELHDTVEQGLTGLSMQLGNIAGDVEGTPEQVRSAIQLAKRMLRHCREESRATIRDLRSIELEQRGLTGALKELLPIAASGCGAEFHMNVSGEPYHLAATVENHLLRIAQESVTNAVHHASPHKIVVDLHYEPVSITLIVRDDGCGFDSCAPPPQGHFGVLGIRERANKMQAKLTIESKLGLGTRIQVIVPITSVLDSATL